MGNVEEAEREGSFSFFVFEWLQVEDMDDEDDNTGVGAVLKLAMCCKTPATSSSDGLRLRRFGLDGWFSC